MINIQQQNPVEQENEPVEFRQVQTSLDDKIYEFVPDTMYVANPIQANTNPSFTGTSGTGNPIFTSQVTSTFNLPVGVFNHSKTLFSMNIQIGNISVSPPSILTSGFTNQIVGAVNNFYCPFIKTVEFYTAAGTRLFYCDSVDKLNRLSGILNLKSSDGSSQGSVRNFMCPSQRTYGAWIGATAGITNTETLNGFPDPFILGGGLLNAQLTAQTILDPSVMFCPYRQSDPDLAPVLGDGNLGPSAASGITTVMRYSFRLGDLLPDSIFNTKKDIYFSKISYIKITFNPINQIGALVTLDTPNGGAPNAYALGGSISSAGTNGYTITNMELTTYSQNNQRIVEEIIESQKFESIPIVLPFVQVSSQQFQSGVSQGATFKISTENSVSSLYKLYYGVFQADNGPLTCNSQNPNEAIWQSTMVKINNTTIRSYLDLTKRQDIAEMAEFFPNNSITSHRAIRYSGVYGMVLDTEPCKKNYTGSDIKGLELKPSNDMIVVFNTQTANLPLTHFLYNVQNRVFFWKGGEAYYIKQM